jgi:prevent-host-death family protein
MTEVTIHELRKHAGEIIDRAARGEHITITRGGKPVAELRAKARPALSAGTLLARWRNVPRVDPAALRADLDEPLDAHL